MSNKDKQEILKILEKTDDDVLLKKVWSCINGYNHRRKEYETT